MFTNPLILIALWLAWLVAALRWNHAACLCCGCPDDCGNCPTSYTVSVRGLKVVRQLVGFPADCDLGEVCTFDDFDVVLTRSGCAWAVNPDVTCDDFGILLVGINCTKGCDAGNPFSWRVNLHVGATSSIGLIIDLTIGRQGPCPPLGLYTLDETCAGGTGSHFVDLCSLDEVEVS